MEQNKQDTKASETKGLAAALEFKRLHVDHFRPRTLMRPNDFVPHRSSKFETTGAPFVDNDIPQEPQSL